MRTNWLRVYCRSSTPHLAAPLRQAWIGVRTSPAAIICCFGASGERIARGSMFYVPLYFEVLRSRPQLMFWVATLAQAMVWLLVPLLFYSAPPGELPQLLAIGNALPLDGGVGPPLAYWLGAAVLRTTGLFGIYVLAQVCVVVTYWCVFALGSAIVGATHAAIAVLLMVGIAVFTVPTPDFSPAILTMALWAVALLHYWRAVGQKRRRSWYVLGVAGGMILLASQAALILLGLLVLFTALSPRARALLGGIELWIVAVALVPLIFLHLLWLEGAADGLSPALARLRNADAAIANTTAWLRLLGALVVAHAGLAILVALAGGWPRSHASPMPAIARSPVEPFAAAYVRTFALVPALLATIFAVLVGARQPVGGPAPLLVLSGLGVVMMAGDSVALYHQRVLGFAWAGLLIVPAIFVPAVIFLLPWTIGTDLQVAQPASAIGRFFAESFERRTGHRLAIVSGDLRTAELVAVAAPSHPSVYFGADPERSPWITASDINEKGAIVLWPAGETSSEPPADIKARFPNLVAEVPQTFTRPVRGRLPPLRIGWGMIRPAGEPATASRPGLR